MSATNTHTGHVTACVARQDGAYLVKIKTPKSGEIIAVHPRQVPEGKTVTVTGYPPRLAG